MTNPIFLFDNSTLSCDRYSHYAFRELGIIRNISPENQKTIILIVFSLQITDTYFILR